MSQPKTIEGRELTKFIDSPIRENSSAVEVVNSGNFTPFGQFDEIQVTYPNNLSEVFTYKFNNTDIGSITVTYTNNSKNNLSSVVYNAV